MTDPYGAADRDRYHPDDGGRPGVFPPRSSAAQPYGSGTGHPGAQPYGAGPHAAPGHDAGGTTGYGGGAYGSPHGTGPGGVPFSAPQVRNDYGQAPPDTDAGRGGAHGLSVAAVVVYLGLFLGLPLLVGLMVLLIL